MRNGDIAGLSSIGFWLTFRRLPASPLSIDEQRWPKRHEMLERTAELVRATVAGQVPRPKLL